MFRASLVVLGIALVLVWLIAVTDSSTLWLTWADGVVAVLTLLLVPVTRPAASPLKVASGPGLLGLVLLALFIAGLATGASAWLTWFTLAFAAGYLAFGYFAFMVRAIEPRMESYRPLTSF